jgi:hypothetical protein
MILSYYDGEMVSINLMYCDADMLVSAVGDTSTEIRKVCKDFCDNRDAYSNPTITTTSLYTLIALFKTYRMIQKVNILDLSCDVMKSLQNEPCFEGYRTPSTCVPLEEGFGWGGKRKRKTKRLFSTIA